MGRRKERRLAALSGAGRRVKLDLSAEPSGDLGGFSTKDDVGEDGDPITQTEFQKHASSGQMQPNTLQLLEQYSDEESDGGSKELKDRAPAEDLSTNTMETKNVDQEKTEMLNNQIEQFLKDLPSEEFSERTDIMDTSKVDFDNVKRQNASVMGAFDHAEHDMKRDEDIVSGWKMVLHEESNCYYYWNVSTGETSWEVPDVFSQAIFETSENNSTINTEGKVDSLKKTEASSEISQLDYVNVIDGKYQSHEGCDITRYSLENGTDSTLSMTLMKKCEILVERLKSSESLNCNPKNHQRMKYLVEIEIRHGDIKALESCGSRLLPFWLHIESHLNHLEIGIDSLIQCIHDTSLSGFENKADINKDAEVVYGTDSSAKLPLFSYNETKGNAAISHLEFQDLSTDVAGLGSHSLSIPYVSKDVGEKNEIHEEERYDFDQRHGPHAGEDVEMDVDMEVEEISSVNSLHLSVPVAHSCASVDPSGIAVGEMVVPGQTLSVFAAAEWIPPPPPDDSLPPPPPADDSCPPPHVEAPYPPSQLDSFSSYQYSGEYAESYPDHSLQYYGQTDIGVASTSVYGQPDAGQICISHLPHYYDQATNAYAYTPLVPNPVDPVATYYGLQSSNLHSGQSIISGTSVTSGEPVPVVADSSLVASLGSVNPNAFESAEIYVKPSTDLDVQTASGTMENSSVAGSVPVSLASSSTSSAAVSKAQSKVSRGKKRSVAVVPTMRTNKKVSGLVDKWKAVKEELSAEDEEPENAYEILEKKRQREIEDWRTNQIASGAAKENANFQPLGGDWRERVKRRKAERIKESKETPGEMKQKPDLVELAKGLPSGWQAYWDESSKQVYYGNVLTSETTWTRPKAQTKL